MNLCQAIKKILLPFIAIYCTSCGVTNFPKQTPFVYHNQIEIKGNQFTKQEKKVLQEKILNQLTDSMRVRIKERLVILSQVVRPAKFDTSQAWQSLKNIEIFFQTIGYYNIKGSYNYKIDTLIRKNPSKTQYRTITKFTLNPGKPFKIDSVAFVFNDTPHQGLKMKLQELANQTKGNSLLKKNTIFNESIISDELERLVTLYRNNGYYNFSRELLYAEVDTVFLPLINPMLDPFERMEALKNAVVRKDNPTINVYVRLSPTVTKDQIQQYKIGKVMISPDYGGFQSDTSGNTITESDHIFIKQKSNKFKPSFITAHNHLKPGEIYKLGALNRTFDEFNNLGAWQFVKIDSKIEKSSDSTLADTPKINFDLVLLPVKKYALSADLESVFNQTQQATIGTAGNLIGLGINLGIRNRNFDHQGIVLSHTFRGGIEAGIGQINRGLQATELTYINAITIPKLLLLSNNLNNKFLFKRTFVNANISSIDRNVNNNGLFRLTNIGVSFGWQIRNERDEIITVRPAYLEFVNLYNVSPNFQKQLDTTPFLRYSFTQGLVIGNFMFSFAKPQFRLTNKSNQISSFRFSIEESGLLFGRFKKSIPVFERNLFEYLKGEIEFKHEIRYSKTSWAFRTALGVGYLFNDSTNMPFFKQFTGGGPNSMRAWPLRSIGPGSSPIERREGRNQFFSRSGDMLFETNAEFRYNIATIIPNTLVIRGALFTDIGNVWNLPNKTNRGNDTVVFRIKNFYRDLGVSLGSGFRFDFIGLFLLRIDFGFRVKNPALPFVEKNYGWRNPKPSLANIFSSKEEHKQWRYENFNFSLGINYPF